MRQFRTHNDKLLNPYGVSKEWYAMVHQAIPRDKVRSIKKAKDAVDAEWDALFAIDAFDMASVRPKQQVKDEAYRTKKTVHFGSLMELCHEKHAEKNLAP